MNPSPGDIYSDAELKMNSFGDAKTKYTAAFELFKKAGNEYKKVRNWLRAGDSFRKAADCMLHISNIPNAAENSAEAARNYVKAPNGIDKAVEAFNLSTHQYTECGRHIESCKIYQEAGRLLEAKRPEVAIEYHQKASELLRAQNRGVDYFREDKAVGDLLIKLAKYSDANKHFTKLGIDCIQEGDMKLAIEFCMKGFFSALILHDEILAMNTRDSISQSILHWDEIPEGIFMTNILHEVRAKHYDRLPGLLDQFSVDHSVDRSFKSLFSALVTSYQLKSQM